jgi:UDP-3-O-[3-hydroxymyristoyl] glucosamine N-acyltransferase
MGIIIAVPIDFGPAFLKRKEMSISEWATIGDNLSLHEYVTIYDDVVIGDNVTIFPGAVIGKEPKAAGVVANKPEAIRQVTTIGNNSVIGAHSVIYKGATISDNVLIGDGTKVREDTMIGNSSVVGSNCTIQNGATIGERVKIVDLSHITFDCEIGDESFISVGVYTMNDNSMQRGGRVVGPKIGKRVRIGGGAMLLPGVIIGDDAIIAAGAVVTHNVGQGQTVFGIPAKSRAQSVSYNYDHFYEFDGWPPVKPLPEE